MTNCLRPSDFRVPYKYSQVPCVTLQSQRSAETGTIRAAVEPDGTDPGGTNPHFWSSECELKAGIAEG